MDRYRPFVHRVLTSLTHNSSRSQAASEEFWAYFLESKIHTKADRNRPFRPYLSETLRRYAKAWSRQNWHQQCSDDEQDAPEPAVICDLPEDEEMRFYATTVIHNAIDRLARGADLNGKATKGIAVGLPDSARIVRMYYGLPDTLDGDLREPMDTAAIGSEFGISANAIANRLFKTRANLKAMVIEEIQQTVPSGGDLSSELDLVFAAMQRVAQGIVD
mgnify:CR=1 FL=1